MHAAAPFHTQTLKQASALALGIPARGHADSLLDYTICLPYYLLRVGTVTSPATQLLRKNILLLVTSPYSLIRSLGKTKRERKSKSLYGPARSALLRGSGQSLPAVVISMARSARVA